MTTAFDGYIEHTLRASSTCLVSVDRNRYSIPAQWAGQIVSVRASASHIRVVAQEQLVAEHPRCFGRDQLQCDPWHYLPILEKKPGALRHGVPFQQWDLPVSINVVRDRILKQAKGDRAFVELLLMARSLGDSGLETLEVACDLTLQTGIISIAVVLNEMRRLTEVARPKALEPLKSTLPSLRVEPQADCSRYDTLREVRYDH